MEQKLRLFEMFAGYGGASFALKDLGTPFVCVGYSEIDKYAIQCYEQNHYVAEFDVPPMYLKRSTPCNYGDATKIDPKGLPNFDFLTGGFPCQSFSNAGKGLGELDTRGTLFNDIIRIAEEKKPRYMLLENVKGLIGKKHRATFDKIILELCRIGYFPKWKVLNSKNHGIPQNRERIWIACFRSEREYAQFEFPEEEELTLFLKDILEDEVDEKYFLSEKAMNGLLNTKFNSRRALLLNKEYSSCLAARDYKEPKCIRVKNATKQGYLEAVEGDGLSLEHPNSKTRRGRVQQQMSPTLQCGDTKGVVISNLMIRKLTPTEYFRLQGFLADEINLEGLSNSQRYKLAGNGWGKNVAKKILKNMLE